MVCKVVKWEWWELRYEELEGSQDGCGWRGLKGGRGGELR